MRKYVYVSVCVCVWVGGWLRKLEARKFMAIRSGGEKNYLESYGEVGWCKNGEKRIISCLQKSLSTLITT